MSLYTDFLFSTNNLSNSSSGLDVCGGNPDVNHDASYSCEVFEPGISEMFFSDFRYRTASPTQFINNAAENFYFDNDVYREVTQMTIPLAVFDIFKIYTEPQSILFSQTLENTSEGYRYLMTVQCSIFNKSQNAMLMLLKLRNRRIKLWLRGNNNKIYLLDSMRLTAENFNAGNRGASPGYSLQFDGYTTLYEARSIEESAFLAQNIIY